MEEFAKEFSDAAASRAQASGTSSPDGSGKTTKASTATAGSKPTGKPQQATHETATSYETTELSPSVGKNLQRPVSTPTTNRTPVNAASRRKQAEIRRSKRSMLSPVAINVTDDNEQELLDEDLGWESTYRGMPSWLTSLIIHLSIILLLALFSVKPAGSKIVSLFAAATESVDIENVESFEIVLDPADIETSPDEFEAAPAKISESPDLTTLLDDSLLETSFESVSSGDLFDSVDSSGSDQDSLTNQNAGGAKFFGVEGSGADFIFIVDCSGSMADYGRWGQAKRELKSSIGELTSDQRFLILLYNNGYIAMNDEAELVESTERQQNRAIRWLSKKRPNNWTFCAEALAKALSLKPDAIFLLSDGEFNDREEVFTVLDALNSSKRLKLYGRSQVPVHTIALGSHLGRFTMKRIADENSGNFKLIE